MRERWRGARGKVTRGGGDGGTEITPTGIERENGIPFVAQYIPIPRRGKGEKRGNERMRRGR